MNDLYLYLYLFSNHRRYNTSAAHTALQAEGHSSAIQHERRTHRLTGRGTFIKMAVCGVCGTCLLTAASASLCKNIAKIAT